MRATSSVCAASSQQPARSYHVLSTVSMSLHDVCWSLKQFAYKVIVDIGCMRSVVGVGWATEVLNRWQAEGRWHRVEKESEAFRFGDGEVLYSRYRIEFVGAFAGQAVVFGFSVSEGVCPPLFSRTGCTQLGVVIDCEHHTISSWKLGVKSYGLGRDEGHYTICIDEPCSNMSVVSLPPDFRLPVGTDAMKLSSEVLLEKELVMEPRGSSANDGSRILRASAGADLQTMQLGRPQDEALPDAGGGIRGRGGVRDDCGSGRGRATPEEGCSGSSQARPDSQNRGGSDHLEELAGDGEHPGPNCGGGHLAGEASCQGGGGEIEGGSAQGTDRGEGRLPELVADVELGRGLEYCQLHPQSHGDLRLEEVPLAAEGQGGGGSRRGSPVEEEPSVALQAAGSRGGGFVGASGIATPEDEQSGHVAPQGKELANGGGPPVSRARRPNRGLTQKLKAGIKDGQAVMQKMTAASQDSAPWLNDSTSFWGSLSSCSPT